MVSCRRCGTLSLFVLAILSPGRRSFAISQAVTMVQSSARSAGSSAAGFNGDFGAATTVNLSNPSYIVFDSNGNQFVSDTLNNCVRKIDTAGNITTVAGLAVSGQSDTCNSSSTPRRLPAQGLYQPTGLAIDSTNRLYIADSRHNCVRALVSGRLRRCESHHRRRHLRLRCPPPPSRPRPTAWPSTPPTTSTSPCRTRSAPPRQSGRPARRCGAAINVCLVAGAASANVTAPCPGITNGIVAGHPSGLTINISSDLYIADTGNNCVRRVVGLTPDPPPRQPPSASASTTPPAPPPLPSTIPTASPSLPCSRSSSPSPTRTTSSATSPAAAASSSSAACPAVSRAL